MEGGMEREPEEMETESEEVSSVEETERATEEAMGRDLYIAAREGNVAFFYQPQKKESGILCSSTPYGNTALHIAASYGHFLFVERFIEIYKEDIEACSETLRAQNREENTALHEACSGGNDDIVRILLREDNKLALERNFWGETALFKAAEKGHSSIVKRLLEVAPSQSFRRWDGQTPLHVAVYNSKKDVVDVLLKYKPDLTTEVDRLGRTALHIASSAAFSRRDSIWKLSSYDTNLILVNKSACSIIDENGQTPLHLAVIEGNAGLTEEILYHEPSCIEMVDKNDRSALHLAVQHATQIYGRSANDLRRIMASVTDPTLINCRDIYGQTAWAIAMKKGAQDPQLYRAIRGYLISKGASPQEKERLSSDGNTEEGWLRTEPIMISISLISTVAFAVAFTLPEFSRKFSHDFFFYLLVISDTLAFCYSLGAALLLVFVRGKPHPNLMVYILFAISVAGASLAITFGAAIHVVVAPNYKWLPIIVWFMVLTMIYAGIISFHAKSFLFGGHWRHVLVIIVYPAKLVAVNLLTSLFGGMRSILKICVPATIRGKLRTL